MVKDAEGNHSTVHHHIGSGAVCGGLRLRVGWVWGLGTGLGTVWQSGPRE